MLLKWSLVRVQNLYVIGKGRSGENCELYLLVEAEFWAVTNVSVNPILTQ